jgi:aspartyl protease family protein
MLFWPFVVLSLAVLALAGAGPPADATAVGQNGQPPIVIAAVLAAGLVLALAGRALLRGGTRAAGLAVLWFGIAAVILAGYADRGEVTAAYQRLRLAVAPSAAMSRSDGAAELRRAWDGHYRAEAEVNGVRLQLVVDTGASMVLLPFEEVHALGIDPDLLAFTMPVRTANGASTVAPVRLSSIKIGPIAVFDVEAAVARPGRLDMPLLGMSFLDRLSETSFRGDRLILRN